MTTKTCSNCGWVLAIQDPLTHCPICNTKFSEGICAICKKPVKYYRHNRLVCKHCYDTVTRKPDDNKRLKQRRIDVYNEWVAKVKRIPADYPRLTEAQWLAAVKHFNGCALCQSETVDTRWYFIPFKEGGRYCDWNIIPVCDKCAVKIRITPNYFLYERPAGLIKILDYLEDKVNGAIAKSTTKCN